jgi:hypothetical protein
MIKPPSLQYLECETLCLVLVGILSLANRLGLGVGICIGNILDAEWGQNLFMYSIYIALKMSLEKTIETYKKINLRIRYIILQVMSPA